MKLTKTLVISLLTGTMIIGTIGCSSTQPTTINFNSDEPKVEQYEEEDPNTNTKDNTPVKTTTPQKSQKTPATPKTTTKPSSNQSSNKQQKNTQSSNTQPNNEQQDSEVENPGYNYPRCPLCGEYVTTESAYFAGRLAHYACARNYGEAHNSILDYSIPLIVAPSAPDNSSDESNNAATEGGEINE